MVATISTVTTVTDDTFGSFVEGETPVLVDCWATWCPPCRHLSPIIEELAVELEGKVRFGKLNTDENPRTAQMHGVMSLPTMLIFKGGEKVDVLIGLRPKADILAVLRKHS